MSAKKLIFLGFLAMVLFSWALWTIWEKESKYIDTEVRTVKNIVRVAAKDGLHYVFDIKTGKTENEISKLEITDNAPQGLKRAYGVPADHPITIGYVCGYNKNCGKFKNSSSAQKMDVEVLKKFLQSEDEIEALP